MTREGARYVDTRELAAAIASSPGGTVIFTGAGMSTDSGLPDFRSKDGLWKNIDPMEIATADAMRDQYDLFHEFYSRRFRSMGSALPNPGHAVIADWEARGLVSCVITQNVDGLHRAAGSRTVYELHGSVDLVRCMECGHSATQDDFIARTPCPSCGGRLRPGIVLFGEGLPEKDLTAAWHASERARVFIVLGSSLLVSPANQMPAVARRAGAIVAICNHDPTPMDSMADLRTDIGIADFLAELDSLL